MPLASRAERAARAARGTLERRRGLAGSGPEGRESDGTLEWTSTTIVVVHAHAGDRSGLGYTYCDRAAGALVRSKLDISLSQLLAVWASALVLLAYLGLIHTTGVAVFNPKTKEIRLRKGRKRIVLPFEKINAVLIDKRETWGQEEYQVSIRTASNEALPIRIVGSFRLADRIRSRIQLTLMRGDNAPAAPATLNPSHR